MITNVELTSSPSHFDYDPILEEKTFAEYLLTQTSKDIKQDKLQIEEDISPITFYKNFLESNFSPETSFVFGFLNMRSNIAVKPNVWLNRCLPKAFQVDFLESNFAPEIPVFIGPRTVAPNVWICSGGASFVPNIWVTSRHHWYSDSRNEFIELINKRITYINTLRDLDDNWISGNSVAPNEFVINQSIKFLSNFKAFISEDLSLPIPKLIMSPIPVGGFGIEIAIKDNVSVNINVFNNETCQIEYQNQENYAELEILIAELKGKFIQIYAELTRKAALFSNNQSYV